MSIKNALHTILILCLWASVASCSDDDDFSSSPADRLTFPVDTLSMDTVFSRVPTSTRTFWVYNRSGSGLRIANVRLENGNQTGFRTNVDGSYLSPEMGYQANGLELRKGDSLRVFVELTSALTNKKDPQLVQDNLVFTLESGVRQSVNLRAMSWDAKVFRSLVVSNDTTITAEKPIIVYGGITIKEGAMLTIAAGTTLYFHSGAGLDVHGRLVTKGTASENVVLRGDRLDRIFDYLSYDEVSGQWNGLRFASTSSDNVVEYTDLHGAMDGIVCDSTELDKQTLTLRNSIIHNCQGYGLRAVNAAVTAENCQFTNSLNDCVSLVGGRVDLNNCTLAQFYPFDSERGVALSFTNKYGDKTLPLTGLNVRNSIITGYADDVLMGDKDDNDTFEYLFDHCIIRTPADSTDEKFVNVAFEDVDDDEKYGEKHFAKVDIDKQKYDFHLSDRSAAIGFADKTTATMTDRDGTSRDESPDAGCYEYVKPEKQ